MREVPRRLRRPLPTALRPLRHRTYRLLIAGQLISNLGDWLALLALYALIVYQWDQGARGVGALLTAQTLPYAVIAPLAGVLADRWPRRAVMVVCDLARAGTTLGLAWAPNLGVALALVLLTGVCSSLFAPAQSATVRSTVPEEDLLAAGALSTFVTNSARFLGPALGGIVVGFGGARTAFLVDAVSFLASAAILSRLPALATTQPSRDEQQQPFGQALLSGLRHLARRRELVLAAASMVAVLCLLRASDTLLPVVGKALGVSEGRLGLFFTGSGLGYIVGAAAVGQWGQRVPPLAIAGAALLAIGGLTALIGLAALRASGHNAGALFAAGALLGCGYAALLVSYGYVFQRATPPELMGRVSGTMLALNTGAPLLVPLGVTFLTSRLEVSAIYVGTGLALVLIGLVVLGLRSREGDA